jgi:predicted alpha/beta superfamily hydrolase
MESCLTSAAGDAFHDEDHGNLAQPPNRPADGAMAFEPLPLSTTEPSELDANPRFLRLRGLRSRFLPTRRDVLVYLPEAYLKQPLSAERESFPVFYLHDGQNLFDGRTAYVTGKTWCAHTTADYLTAAGRMQPTILVGIDNTGLRRMAEYTPTRDAQRGGGSGARYGSLLVEELKPLIDSTFRTKPGPRDTGLGGSSLGGLISLALGLEYPEVFGRLAVLSPSVWWDQRSILRLVGDFRTSLLRRAGVAGQARERPRIWLDMGTSEGLRHLRDTDLLYRRLQLRGWKGGVDLRYLRVPGGLHEETAWAARFGQVLEFLFPASEQPSATDI